MLVLEAVAIVVVAVFLSRRVLGFVLAAVGDVVVAVWSKLVCIGSRSVSIAIAWVATVVVVRAVAVELNKLKLDWVLVGSRSDSAVTFVGVEWMDGDERLEK